MVELLLNPVDGRLRQKILEAQPDIVPLAPRPAKVQSRPRGWVKPLVLAVLRDASEPLTTMEISRVIQFRFHEAVDYQAVRHVVQRSPEAKNGTIMRSGKTRYCVSSTQLGG